MSPATLKELPPLEAMTTAKDFETAGRANLDALALGYISGGWQDTIDRNISEFDNFLLRPRVLKDVSKVDTTTKLFGLPTGLPVYLSGVAKGKLVSRKEGEASFVRAAEKAGSTYLVPVNSSLSLKDIWGHCAPNQKLGFQCYLLHDEKASMDWLDEALSYGAAYVAITVDANAPRSGTFGASTATVLSGAAISSKLNWERLAEIRARIPATTPVYLKGIQIAEDALQAARLGYKGIICSNHGGRSAPDQISSLASLEEISNALRSAGYLNLGQDSSFELYLDGGLRSGRDVFKALCLGARGVGIGRPYYWASACYGQAGIEALLKIFQHELRVTMEQVGATSLEELGPWFLARITPAPQPLAWMPAQVTAKL